METTQSINNKMHKEIVVSSCSGKLYNNKDEWNTARHKNYLLYDLVHLKFKIRQK